MMLFFFFFFNDTATTEIYTLSLHDALPILPDGGAAPGVRSRHPARSDRPPARDRERCPLPRERRLVVHEDRKSTRLNSSHSQISYAVFCLKKKKQTTRLTTTITQSHIDLCT